MRVNEIGNCQHFLKSPFPETPQKRDTRPKSEIGMNFGHKFQPPLTWTAPKNFLNNSRALRSSTRVWGKSHQKIHPRVLTRKFGKIFVTQVLCGTFCPWVRVATRPQISSSILFHPSWPPSPYLVAKGDTNQENHEEQGSVLSTYLCDLPKLVQTPKP